MFIYLQARLELSNPGYFETSLVGDVEHPRQTALSRAAPAFVLRIAVNSLSQSVNQFFPLEGGLG